MKALIAAASMMLVVALPTAASAQNYPPASGADVTCSYSEPTVSCTGTGFAANSSVTVTTSASTAVTGLPITATETADSSGTVQYQVNPPCTNSVTVTMDGTDADGNATADSATVDTSACSGGGGGGDNLPQTGGGLALLGGLAVAGGVALRRRS